MSWGSEASSCHRIGNLSQRPIFHFLPFRRHIRNPFCKPRAFWEALWYCPNLKFRCPLRLSRIPQSGRPPINPARSLLSPFPRVLCRKGQIATRKHAEHRASLRELENGPSQLGVHTRVRKVQREPQGRRLSVTIHQREFRADQTHPKLGHARRLLRLACLDPHHPAQENRIVGPRQLSFGSVILQLWHWSRRHVPVAACPQMLVSNSRRFSTCPAERKLWRSWGKSPSD